MKYNGANRTYIPHPIIYAPEPPGPCVTRMMTEEERLYYNSLKPYVRDSKVSTLAPNKWDQQNRKKAFR
jgi:hypothetical protein